MKIINTSLNSINTNEKQKLSDPKILNHFISCLKYQNKQQENKKKNYKKLMNLFSVRVQKYDDSSSHNKTDEKFKNRKNEFMTKITTKRRKNFNHRFTNTTNNHNIKNNTTKNKKCYDSSRSEIVEDIYEKINNNINNQVSVDEMENEFECNSDSSIYTHNKEKVNQIYSEDDDINQNNFKKRKTFSMNKVMMNERAKFIKHKFNKQMDYAKSKKFSREDNLQNLNNEINYIRVNNLIENSVYNSVNSTEKKVKEDFVNYYLVNRLEDDKDLILYNNLDESNAIKFNENYKCYYSLDHKSRIIYIKPSPTLLSILNSKIISSKRTQNISNEESNKQTPQNNLNLNILNFDHNVIIEKLKNLELSRDDKEIDPSVKTIVHSSENEDESENEN